MIRANDMRIATDEQSEQVDDEILARIDAHPLLRVEIGDGVIVFVDEATGERREQRLPDDPDAPIDPIDWGDSDPRPE